VGNEGCRGLHMDGCIGMEKGARRCGWVHGRYSFVWRGKCVCIGVHGCA
jgi:hypothetical protein